MKSSFLPKYEPKIVKISNLTTQGRNPDNFCSYFGRNDDLINSFWNLLTFSEVVYRQYSAHYTPAKARGRHTITVQWGAV